MDLWGLKRTFEAMRNPPVARRHGRGFAAALLAASSSAVLFGCGDGSDSAPSVTSEAPTTTASPSDAASPDDDASESPVVCGVPSGDTSGGAGPVDSETAGRIVTDTYGGRVIDVEEGTEDGRPVWEVEATDSSCGRIEVEVDKATGSIVSFDTED